MNATTLARNLIRQLIEFGVSDFVLSPGSRNAPLSIALHEAESAGLINLYVKIDERGAAFFALGISKASDNYVGVICTSGTAAANYHPAALEAYHSENKLLIITADRPARLRQTGANQTTLQDGLLAPLDTVDIASAIVISDRLREGPVHFNVQFDEPLLPADEGDWLKGLAPHPKNRNSAREAVSIEVKPHGLLIVGHDRAGFEVGSISKLARDLSWPLIAEDPLSFPQAISHASLFFSDAELRSTFKPEQIIVIGRTTLSRSINALISECSDVIVIDPRTERIDIKREASQILTSLPEVIASPDSDWLAKWNQLSEFAQKNISLEWSEQLAISTIAKNLPDDSALFIGSSRPIRDVEAFAAPRTGVHTFANRGLAGIDGNISTAFGIAERYQRTFAILGDVTFLHDISALANPTSADLTIFVIDNDGGGIFSTLPQAKVEGFEKIFGTPHHLDLVRVIVGFGGVVTRVKSACDLIHSIIHPSQGLKFVVIEVPDRLTNADKLKEVTQSLVSALRIGSNLA